MNDEARTWLQRRAIQAAPQEVCGFIMENGDIVEIRNVATNPHRAFRMDHKHMVEKLSGREDFIAGIWHTHPKGTTTPSHADLNAIKIGAVQRNWDYWIVTADSVTLVDSGRYMPQSDGFWETFAR